MSRNAPSRFLQSFRCRGWRQFFGRALRCLFSWTAWRWLVSGCWRNPALNLVWLSPWFDRKWVERRYPESKAYPRGAVGFVLERGVDGSVRPGPDFDSDEYLALHVDLIRAGVHPLVDYEGVGQFNRKAVSFLELEPRFPEGAVPLRESFPAKPPARRRTAIFASFSPDGRIRERTLFLLRGVAAVSDNVVFVSSAPLFPDEAGKLRGLVSDILCEPHGEYDFGSWKRGWKVAESRGLLVADAADELILCNDSCFGPVFPLEESFESMRGRPCDFWGLTVNDEGGAEHVQSYFVVFRRRVLDDPSLGEFLSGVRSLTGRGSAIVHYETRLTAFLHGRGFSYDSLVPRSFLEEAEDGYPNPMLRPLELMRRWRMPLVKVKAFDGEIREDPYSVLDVLRAANPALGRLVFVRERRGESLRRNRLARRLRETLPSTWPRKAAAIRARAERGDPIRCTFFVSAPGAFPARPLFDALSAGAAGPFRPVACVVPDRRAADPEAVAMACAADLVRTIPADRILCPRPNVDGVWPDVLGEADVAVYPAEHAAFPFPYRPRWAVGRAFLPVLAAPTPATELPPGTDDAIRFWAELPPDGGVSAANPAGALSSLVSPFEEMPENGNRT